MTLKVFMILSGNSSLIWNSGGDGSSFLPHLGDEEGTHARAGASAKGVCQLETLEAVTALGLLPHHVKDAVHQLSSLSVVTLGPVVPGPRLTEDKVVWPEDGTKSTRSSEGKVMLGPLKVKVSHLTLSMVPGSRSTKTALGTYLALPASL